MINIWKWLFIIWTQYEKEQWLGSKDYSEEYCGLLQILLGGAEYYHSWASQYYEIDLELALVIRMFELEPIDNSVLNVKLALKLIQWCADISNIYAAAPNGALVCRTGFRRGISAGNPVGVHEYRDVRRNHSKILLKPKIEVIFVLVIRGTKKLLQDLKIERTITKIDSSDSFFSWHANVVVVNRRKHLIFMNDLSRLSLTIVGVRSTQYKNLKNIFLKELTDYLISENLDEARINQYINDCADIIFTTTNNRSVISTMNDVVLIMQNISFDFANYIELNKWNNDSFYKPINYSKPIEVFKQEIENRYSRAW